MLTYLYVFVFIFCLITFEVTAPLAQKKGVTIDSLLLEIEKIASGMSFKGKMRVARVTTFVMTYPKLCIVVLSGCPIVHLITLILNMKNIIKYSKM